MTDLVGDTLELKASWTVDARINGGGFGEVYQVSGRDGRAAAKFVPKAPGAERELLFADVPGATNVVPIIDDGEHGDFWVLVMSLAEMSLRQHLEA